MSTKVEGKVEHTKVEALHSPKANKTATKMQYQSEEHRYTNAYMQACRHYFYSCIDRDNKSRGKGRNLE